MNGTAAGTRLIVGRATLGVAFLVALISPTCGSAQAVTDPRAVQPERPTVATHAGNVAPGWLELESGIEADRFDDGSHALGSAFLIKVGLASHLQLNIGVPLTRPPGGTVGLGDMALGVKWRILDHAPIVHDLAILPSVKFSTGSASAGRGTGTTDLSILAISSRTVGPVSVDLNLGYTRRSGDGSIAPKDATLWTASFGFPLRGAFGGVAELYGYPSTSGPAGSPGIVAVLAGPTFLLKPWLAMDAGVIIPVRGPQPHALYAGGVWNAGRLWRVAAPAGPS